MTKAVRVSVSLGGLGLILMLTGAVGCRRSPQATRDRHMESGKRFLAAKEYSHALVEFRNAAGAMPNDAEAYYQIGEAALGTRDTRNAAWGFRKALELDPKHARAQFRLAQMMTASGDPGFLKDAENRLHTLMESSPVTREMLNTLALTELRLGKADEAAQTLEQGLTNTPQSLDSSVMLARARLVQKDVKGAEGVLKKACDAAPKSADPRVILGRFYVAQKRWEEAEAEFQRALKLHPRSAPALMDLALLQRNYLGRKPEAEANFKHLADSGEKPYKPVYAVFLFQEGRRDEAIRELEKLVREDPDDRHVRTLMVSAYRAANRTPDAEKLLSQALEKNPNDLEALLQRGELRLTAGKIVLAEVDMNLALQRNPDAPEVHYVIAKLHQARGAAHRYRQELSEALKLNAFLLPARIELAQSLIASNQAKAALDVLNATPNSQKALSPVLEQRNWAFWALGELGEMRKGIDLGLSRQRSTGLLIQDGVWKLRSGNSAGARVSLEEALKINSADLRALSILKDSYVADKKPAVAILKVKEYAARQPKSAPVQDFLGLLLMANGERQEARKAFAAAKAADPEFARPDLSLVQLDAMEGKWDDAHARLKALVSASPANTTGRLWLGNIEVLKGNHKAALEHFQKVVENDPRNAQAVNNLAYALIEYTNRPYEALEYARKAVALAPDQPAMADTLGWVLYRMGSYSAAVKYLERAALQKEANVVSKYHLAMAYAKMGDPKRGRTALESALKINPNLPEAKLAQELLGERR